MNDDPDRGGRRARREMLEPPAAPGAGDAWLRHARRDDRRRTLRRQRRIAVVGGGLIAAAGIAVGATLALGGGGGHRATSTSIGSLAAAAPPAVSTIAVVGGGQVVQTTPTTPAKRKLPAAPVLSGPPGAVRVSGLRVLHDPIPYGVARKHEMADYALLHYGVYTWQLKPRMIVLHFTDSSTYASAHETFAADTPAPGPAGTIPEVPGTCSHFIVDEDGIVYQQVPVNVMCRHAIGVNDTALGIEMVQSGADGARAADAAILHRPAQIGAVVKLVKALQTRYGIATRDVIGHAMANSSPRFHDLEHWTNDHDDWQAPDVAVVRRRLGGLG